MRQTRSSPLARLAPAVATVLVLAVLPRAGAQPNRNDPVEDLRLALKAPVRDLAGRAREVNQAVGRLAGITDCRQALTLQEWRDQDPDEQLAAVDRAARTAVTQRFEEAVRDALRRGDGLRRLAVANLLTELGTKARAVRSRQSVTRDLAKDLAPLVTNEDARVRQAAARALGQITADPAIAAAALGGLLASRDASDRIAAAQGLAGALQVASELGLRSRTTNAVEFTKAELVQTAKLLVPVAARGVAADQIEVRRLCLEAVGYAAAALCKLVPDPRRPTDPDELAEYRRLVEDELTALQPLAQVLQEQGAVLTRALLDADTGVRLRARQGLEDCDVAALRLRALRGAAATAETEPQPRPGILVQPAATGTAAVPPARVAALAAGLTDKDARARRAALDVLETLGPAAKSVAPALVHALADPDRFVRWAAARVLGKLGPVEEATAVPALAKLLEEDDLNVRMAAATALERFGRPAAPAVPGLVNAVANGDVELQITAMRALQAIHADAPRAVPTLVKALRDPDARVRQTAAETLGAFGPAARAALDPLRKLLNDDVAEVRRAASGALLALADPTPRK
jgi:HEAT repeat protein